MNVELNDKLLKIYNYLLDTFKDLTEYDKIILYLIIKNGQPEQSYIKKKKCRFDFRQHHIKSKAHGGGDNAENLVWIPPEEHEWLHLRFKQILCKKTCLLKAAEVVTAFGDVIDLTDEEEKFLYEWAIKEGFSSCDIFVPEEENLCDKIIYGEL